jgi:hypothetical protein
MAWRVFACAWWIKGRGGCPGVRVRWWSEDALPLAAAAAEALGCSLVPDLCVWGVAASDEASDEACGPKSLAGRAIFWL